MENKQMEETPADPGADSLGSAGLSNLPLGQTGLPSERVLPQPWKPLDSNIQQA